MTEASDDFSAAAVHAVSMPLETATSVMDAAQAAQLGFRQYVSFDSLLDTLPAATVGCVVLCPGQDPAQVTPLMQRLHDHFSAISVVGLVQSTQTDFAVNLMQQGAYTALTVPVDPERFVQTLREAVQRSHARQQAWADSHDAAQRLNATTEKEREVLQLVVSGHRNKEIARVLGITVRAVEDRRFRLMRKVRVDSVAELVALAVTAQFHSCGLTAAARRPALPASTSKSPVRALEVWLPNDSHDHLQLSAGCYQDAADTEALSRQMMFRRGEGLPGRIWNTNAPAFLNELIATDFVRATEASADGITTAVGFPVFCDQHLSAVVLILLDGRPGWTAAFETWRLKTDTSTWRLAGGTFINCERLRRLTLCVELPIGKGLAGHAAQQRRPDLSSQLADNHHAVRGPALVTDQLASALTLPLPTTNDQMTDVFVMLQSQAAPVFSLLQVWEPTPDRQSLRLTQEIYNGVASSRAQTAKVQAKHNSLVQRAKQIHRPILSDMGRATATIPAAAQTPTLLFGIAIPTIVEQKVVAVTVLAH